jgi:hypothetical protein
MAHDYIKDIVDYLNNNDTKGVSWWEDTYGSDAIPLGIVEEDLLWRIGKGTKDDTAGVYDIKFTIITDETWQDEDFDEITSLIEQALQEIFGHFYFNRSAYAIDNQTGWHIHVRDYVVEFDIT